MKLQKSERGEGQNVRGRRTEEEKERGKEGVVNTIYKVKVPCL